jgi:hypothetical protein
MLTHRSLIVFAMVVVLSSGMVPAFADGDGWGNIGCGQNPYPGCELGAGSARTTGSGPAKPSLRASGAGAATPAPPVLCSYLLSDYRPPPGTPSPGQGGAWYVYKCPAGSRNAFTRLPLWMLTPPGGPSPAALAARARDELRLPDAVIELSPVGQQLVNLPTWLWLDRAGWAPVSARASVPGVSVTATARPDRVSWSMGDGTAVTCHGPGTPYASGDGDPTRGSPDCGHTYRHPSSGQPGGVYVVTATVHWLVSWSGPGRSGAFAGLTTSAAVRVPVAESQAVNTR